MAVFSSSIADSQQEWLPKSVTPFHVTVTVPTTALQADDAVLLYQFPTNPFGNEVWFERCIVDLPDLDAGATLTLSFGIGDSDGVLNTVLLSSSTAGQTGVNAIVLDYADIPVDVSGLYLIMDVDSAATTPQAGDVEVFGAFAGGVQSKTAVASEV